MEAVPDSLPAWTIAEAMERTSKPDGSADRANGKARITGQPSNELRDLFLREQLAVTGCFETPTAPPVPIDKQTLRSLDWAGPPSSTLKGQAGSDVEVFNVRVFPILRAP